jgi:hypothetical protein
MTVHDMNRAFVAALHHNYRVITSSLHNDGAPEDRGHDLHEAVCPKADLTCSSEIGISQVSTRALYHCAQVHPQMAVLTRREKGSCMPKSFDVCVSSRS